MNKKRNYGIDLIKIIACVLVIVLHSLNPTTPAVEHNIIRLSIYYIGTLAIPIFFMASGYFVLNKKNISYFYSFLRIKNIFIILFSWILLFSVIYFIIKHKFCFFNEMKGSIFANVAHSHFYHFWFFWALMIMLLIAPMLAWILRKSFKYFLVLTIIVTVICWIQDLSLHFGYTNLMKNIPQVFRLNIWIEYYLLGGIIGNAHFRSIKNYVKSHFIIFSIIDILLYIILIGYSLWNSKIIGWVYAEANYNNILVMLISVISMTLFAVANLRVDKIIECIISATMGIYILQSFAISALGKVHFFAIHPIFMIPVVFIACLIIVKIALHLPIIRNLFVL